MEQVVYTFQCDKTLAQMLEALRAGTPWEWKETVDTKWTADFGWWWSCDCLRARMRRGLVVKIFDGEIQLEFYTPEAQRDCEKLTSSVLEELLPLLGARDISRISEVVLTHIEEDWAEVRRFLATEVRKIMESRWLPTAKAERKKFLATEVRKIIESTWPREHVAPSARQMTSRVRIAEGSLNNPVLLYDGVCGFCNKTVQLILRHDQRGTMRFAALQSSYGKTILARHPELRGTDSVVVVTKLGDEEHVLVRSEAALSIASYLGGVWTLFLIARIVPRPVRDFFYDLFAKYRYKLFGRYDHCLVPSPDARPRFLDTVRHLNFSTNGRKRRCFVPAATGEAGSARVSSRITET